jgi:hypothetical protein
MGNIFRKKQRVQYKVLEESRSSESRQKVMVFAKRKELTVCIPAKNGSTSVVGLKPDA